MRTGQCLQWWTLDSCTQTDFFSSGSVPRMNFHQYSYSFVVILTNKPVQILC